MRKRLETFACQLPREVNRDLAREGNAATTRTSFEVGEGNSVVAADGILHVGNSERALARPRAGRVRQRSHLLFKSANARGDARDFLARWR
jgi:hypothetical protein